METEIYKYGPRAQGPGLRADFEMRDLAVRDRAEHEQLVATCFFASLS